MIIGEGNQLTIVGRQNPLFYLKYNLCRMAFSSFTRSLPMMKKDVKLRFFSSGSSLVCVKELLLRRYWFSGNVHQTNVY